MFHLAQLPAEISVPTGWMIFGSLMASLAVLTTVAVNLKQLFSRNPPLDRQLNTFFTRKEAREMETKLRAEIRENREQNEKANRELRHDLREDFRGVQDTVRDGFGDLNERLSNLFSVVGEARATAQNANTTAHQAMDTARRSSLRP